MPEFFKPGTRKGNKFYIVRGYIDGRRYEIATKSRNKAGAEDHWEDAKRLVRTQRTQNTHPKEPTFAHAVDLYRKANPHLSKNDDTFIESLRDHLGNRLLSELTQADIHGAAHALYPGCLPQTKNRNALTPAASVLHYAADSNLMPWMRIKKFRETDPYRPIAMPDDAEKAIAKAEELGHGETAAAILTLAYQGWRITETLRTKHSLINWKEKTLARQVAKSGKWHTVAIEPDVIDAWKTLPLHGDGRLFSWKDRYAFYRAIDALGLDFHYRPHMSRRGFATELKNRGVDKAGIAEAGQWEDERSVGVYVADNLERQRATLAILRPDGGRNGGKKKKTQR